MKESDGDRPPSQSLTERATLHRVIRKVRPLPGHPLYWKIQFGILNVWLYSDSPEAAADTAEKIIEVLPYERVGTQARVFLVRAAAARSPGDQSDETREEMDLREQLAAETGLSLLLICVTLGADETDFESWPLG